VTADKKDPRGLHGDPERTLTVTPVLRGRPAERDEDARPPLPLRYRDLGLIARGGFGEVRRALDQHLGRVVAIKLLHGDLTDTAHIRVRFLKEAKLTAGLEHPGIVPVHDWGILEDGRLWFSMREVRGTTLRSLIEELHASAVEGVFRTTASGWTFRRLVDAFARACQAVAFAHRRGVVHRDLKPDNIMIGELGEVLVMDWGLGRRTADAEETDLPGIDEDSPEFQAELTQLGDVLGTPAYMPPEQASGAKHLHGLHSDVYSLGAILYHLLSGKKPYEGGKISVLNQVRQGPPTPVLEVAQGKAVPAELLAICTRAMRPKISDRYLDAEALASEVVAWLDGVRRREQALAALNQAGVARPEIAALRAETIRSLTEARELLASCKPFDPVDRKLPGWELEDRAALAARNAALLETSWLEKVHGALSLDPELPEAHALLAEHYRERLLDAELGHRDEDVARFEVLLAAHDRGRHKAFLRGDGTLSLTTDPPGAKVSLETYTLRSRRLTAEPLRELGTTPLRGVTLKRGAYLLRIQAPGCEEVRYPILIERDGHWDGRRPGDQEARPVKLPRGGALAPWEVHIPAGWSWTGGDLLAMDVLPRRRLWIDAFILGRYPVTNAEYLEFLNDLLAQGREDEALAACPLPGRTLSESQGQLAYGRDGQGRFTLDGGPGLPWRPDWPVVLIDWHGASAYARWLARKTGLPYRLPDEIEREKAARGVDGRFFPWGNHFDATWACIIDSHEGDPARVGVHEFPLDESPYGVRGLAGNVRDWCCNLWTREGPPVESERLQIVPAADEDGAFRSVRGGAWKSLPDLSRGAARFASRPAQRWTTTGFRVARSFDASTPPDPEPTTR
jgi:serine/threonine protein kinase/formylglycine-generating enzyme required for sulfatase activity